MPRRREVPKRHIIPDPKYKDKLVSKFTNTLMFDGKKAVAEGILYGAFDVIGERFKEDPVEVPARRARTLAVRWLVEFARNRREKSMAQRLANELLDAQSQQGGAYKRKDDIFRMAQANKAFAHYRW